MKFKSLILTAFMAVAGLSANAQDTQEVTYEYLPHWYFQGNVGAQYTLGEAKFMDLISPNAQLGVGYNFNPVLGARLLVNAWQSKGGWSNKTEAAALGFTNPYKWNYVAPSLDLTINLSNLISGFNPKRIVDISLFLGPEANIAFKNDEANANYSKLAANYTGQPSAFEMDDAYNWTGTKVRVAGHFGLDIDFKVSDRVKINLEGAANILSDKYNSKKANNADWYFNALLGVKVALGKTYNTIVPEPVPVPVVDPTPAPTPQPKPVVKPVQEKTINVFFKIRESIISATENAKVQEMIAFLKENPEAKVSVTGYADVGTGNPRINLKYSQDRANVVTKALIDGGIAADRITTDAKGDTVQPFAENDSNRVAIAIAK